MDNKKTFIKCLYLLEKGSVNKTLTESFWSCLWRQTLPTYFSSQRGIMTAGCCFSKVKSVTQNHSDDWGALPIDHCKAGKDGRRGSCVGRVHSGMCAIYISLHCEFLHATFWRVCRTYFDWHMWSIRRLKLWLSKWCWLLIHQRCIAAPQVRVGSCWWYAFTKQSWNTEYKFQYNITCIYL